MILVQGLSKNYGKTRALNNVDLELKPGHIIGLCGPNGSGKTTLIKILNGLLNDYVGNIRIDGQEIGKHSKSLISYLPDQTYLAGWMNGEDAIRLFRDMYLDFDEERMRMLLDKLKLSSKQSIKTMSKGMKEKFQLALVMSRHASIYILDEPIGGVDPAARELILNTILENYNPNSILLISTHLISDIESIFDSVVFLKDGEVVLHEDVETLRSTHGKSVDELFREVFKC
jgi:ABC-2 type transport system ATP-binding protein